MNTARRLMVALAVAAVVLSAGVAYELLRPANYVSQGAMVLAPLPEQESDLTNLLQGFDRSGTMGTFVELISSRDTLRRAGDPPVGLTVRAVPDTRVILVETDGDESIVNPALSAVFAAARDRRDALSDLWDLRVLETASSPKPAPPSTVFVLLATLVLALLGAAITFVLLSRLFGNSSSLDDLDFGPEASDEVAPRTSRSHVAR